jgi:hypothetical protein
MELAALLTCAQRMGHDMNPRGVVHMVEYPCPDDAAHNVSRGDGAAGVCPNQPGVVNDGRLRRAPRRAPKARVIKRHDIRAKLLGQLPIQRHAVGHRQRALAAARTQ